MRAEHLNSLKPSELECQRFLNMQIQTYPSTLNLGLTVNNLLEELEDRFPLLNPAEDATMNQVMYRAGQRSVVEWVYSRLSEEGS